MLGSNGTSPVTVPLSMQGEILRALFIDRDEWKQRAEEAEADALNHQERANIAIKRMAEAEARAGELSNLIDAIAQALGCNARGRADGNAHVIARAKFASECITALWKIAAGSDPESGLDPRGYANRVIHPTSGAEQPAPRGECDGISDDMVRALDSKRAEVRANLEQLEQGPLPAWMKARRDGGGEILIRPTTGAGTMTTSGMRTIMAGVGQPSTDDVGRVAKALSDADTGSRVWETGVYHDLARAALAAMGRGGEGEG